MKKMNSKILHKKLPALAFLILLNPGVLSQSLASDQGSRSPAFSSAPPSLTAAKAPKPVLVEPAPSPSATSPQVVSDANLCAELPPGGSRVIDYSQLPTSLYMSGSSMNSGIVPQYLLKRLSDTSDGKSAYEAVVNIHFVVDQSQDPSIIAPMLELVDRCYAALPTMETSSGQTLRIRRAAANEPAPDRQVSLISQSMPREDMIHWSTQTTCRVIVHETLHLLGLVDGYREDALKTEQGNLLYDCRKLGAPDSVMRSYVDAHFSSGHYISTSCSCEHTECADELAAIKEVPQSCPQDAVEEQIGPIGIDPYDLDTSDSSLALFNAQIAPYLKTGKHVDEWDYEFYSLQPDSAPLLYPAELRMLLYPGCIDKNKVYYQCAANAYRTSSQVACLTNQPDACSDPLQWLQ